MNRLKSPLRRMLAATAGALIGVSGILACTGPANAQTPHQAPACVKADKAKVSHTFDGPKGLATVTLQGGRLCEGEVLEFALVSYLAPSAKFALPQYVFDSEVKKFEAPVANSLAPVTQTLQFEVEVPTCYTQVDLVKGSRIISPLVSRDDLYGDRKLAAYNGGKGTCVAKPEAEFKSDCTGNVTVTVINRGSYATTFVVTGEAGFTKTVRVAPTKFEEISVPAASAKNIVVKADGKDVKKGGWEKPKDCAPPAQPELTFQMTCTELVVTLKVPAGGKPVTVTLTPNQGQPQKLTGVPGQTTPPAVFKAVPGLVVTPSAEGLQNPTPVAWKAPQGCTKPTPTPTPTATPTQPGGGAAGGKDDEPILPVTGVAAGAIAGGAAVLLAIGVALFLIARRRRVTFTP